LEREHYYPKINLVGKTPGPAELGQGPIGSQLGKGPIESGIYYDGIDNFSGHVPVQETQLRSQRRPGKPNRTAKRRTQASSAGCLNTCASDIQRRGNKSTVHMIKMVRCRKFWFANRTTPSNRTRKLHRATKILQLFSAASHLHRKSINFVTEQIFHQKLLGVKNKGLLLHKDFGQALICFSTHIILTWSTSVGNWLSRLKFLNIVSLT